MTTNTARTYTDAQQRTFAALLAEPHRAWTVADIAGVLPDVSVNRLRATLLLLLGDHLMDIDTVDHRPSLTLRLTSDGHRTLAAAVRGCQTHGSEQIASAAEGGRNAR